MKKNVFVICCLFFLFQAELVSEAKRVIVLSPAQGEIIFALGAEEKLIGRTDVCDYPPEIEKIPVIGGFDGKSLSLESIVVLNPDLVLLTETMHNHLEKPLNQFGIKTYMTKGESIEGVLAEIEEIGKLIGKSKKAEEVIAGIRTEIKLASENKMESKTGKPKVYWEVWSSPFMSCGKTAFMNDVIEAAGGKNIFDSIEAAYPVVSEEKIISQMPDVIIIPKSSGITFEIVEKRPGWDLIPAVKNRKVFVVDDDLFTRPGPRTGKVVLELNKLISN